MKLQSSHETVGYYLPAANHVEVDHVADARAGGRTLRQKALLFTWEHTLCFKVTVESGKEVRIVLGLAIEQAQATKSDTVAFST